MHSKRYPPLEVALVALLFAMVVFIGVGLASCQTYDALTTAPEEFWMTVETLVGALLADFWSLVEMIL